MTSKKQKEKKKKARELKAKARVASRRHKLNQIKKEEIKTRKLNEKFRERIVPIIKDSEKKKEIEDFKMEKSKEKLEKNMQILKALEEEYLKEKERKQELNNELEKMGHSTLQEKLNALESKGREMSEEGSIDLTKKV